METKTDIYHSISIDKASQLYWLGRYTERVYTSLHLLRKHFDLMIDFDKDAYQTFCFQMGIKNVYTSANDFMERYLYDETNSDSVVNMLERAKDNAILLRKEITSETLSYIELSIAHIHQCKADKKGINDLQAITDYMLAFWGSIDERIFTSYTRNVLKFGKYLECAELNIRFDYSFARVRQICKRLVETIDKECYIYDELALMMLEQQMTADQYKSPATLLLLNKLFKA
jgi:uncharacterized alpha-E superfamily protein